jgi:LuxR family maltose regulon positive regulatory protein
LAFEAQGRLLDAMAPLRKALLRAEPEGYVRLFTDEGTPMARLLDEAGRRAILPEYVRRLRRSFAPATVSTSLTTAGASQHPRADGPQDAGDRADRPPDRRRELFVSLNTLRTHTKHIFEKLAVNTRPAAVRRGQEQGLI